MVPSPPESDSHLVFVRQIISLAVLSVKNYCVTIIYCFGILFQKGSPFSLVEFLLLTVFGSFRTVIRLAHFIYWLAYLMSNHYHFSLLLRQIYKTLYVQKLCLVYTSSARYAVAVDPLN